MKRLSIYLATYLVVLTLTTRGIAQTTQPVSDATTFRWMNPLGPVLRDPQIQYVDGQFYMAATSPPFFEHLGQSPGVQLWSSPDLVTWSEPTTIIAAGNWYQARFWAPEIFHNRDDGKFYCTFNCPSGPGAKGPQSVALAVADKITGPYTVMTADKPLCEGNDSDLFRDDDGKVYLFRSGLNAIQVDLPHAKTVGESFAVLPKGPIGAWDGRSEGAPAVGEEGPFVFKQKDVYYCFYSSWGRGYEVGYATAPSVKGPWTRAPQNPIYGAQDEAWCKQYKHTFDQDRSIPWRQVGHNSIFTGPDGRLWIAAHALRKGDDVKQSRLVIDPLIEHDGIFEKTPVSFTEQSIAKIANWQTRSLFSKD